MNGFDFQMNIGERGPGQRQEDGDEGEGRRGHGASPKSRMAALRAMPAVSEVEMPK